jgi:hypothetical protein
MSCSTPAPIAAMSAQTDSKRQGAGLQTAVL